jgi:aminodeoxyfutalosine synthase
MSIVESTIINHSNDNHLKTISDKVLEGTRITREEGLYLFEHAPLGVIGMLANFVRTKLNGNKTFFNKNFHIEPTNICVFDCKFCSYSRLLKNKGDAWELSAQQMLDIVKSYEDKPVTEVHIVGGVHPKLGLVFFGDLFKEIKAIRPDIHIKAFTAVEIEYMSRKAKKTYKEALAYLQSCGMGSLPGGGAEIFNEEVRNKICEDKCTSAQWLEIHETAHSLGMSTNATMLYGHIESYENRIDHMDRLRTLQDRTNGFNTFIPLKFRNKDNQMSDIKEVSVIEDLRNYAIARIYLDNFQHIKAYWPMIGRNTAQIAMQYGVDDIDGTIDDSTKIYSMAGAEEQNPSLTTRELVNLIKGVGKIPIERDTLYNEIKDYSNVVFEMDELEKAKNYN